jgi:hypothetical protein
MTTLNAYDNQIYAWGKGPTQMMVSAPAVGIATNTPITIRGTIMDISAGTKQEATAANFPNGLPCISEASQSDWMEYVYMQQSKPTNATGVAVQINVEDGNGNFRTVGTTTSDDAGMFTFTWTPDIAGDYKVIANFAGSESYYASSAETSFHASEPAASSTPQSTSAASMADQYFLPAVIGIILVVVICFAILALILLRKKP